MTTKQLLLILCYLPGLAQHDPQDAKNHTQKHSISPFLSQVKIPTNLNYRPTCFIIASFEICVLMHTHTCTRTLVLYLCWTLDIANRTLTVLFKPILRKEVISYLLTFRKLYYNQKNICFLSYCGCAELKIRLCYLLIMTLDSAMNVLKNSCYSKFIFAKNAFFP